jgi:hypothetical protein
MFVNAFTLMEKGLPTFHKKKHHVANMPAYIDIPTKQK